MTNQELGQVLRNCRFKASMNQSQLASILHMDRTDISRIENGKKSPYFSLVQDWLEATGCHQYMTILITNDDDLKASLEAVEKIERIKEIIFENNLEPIA